MAVRNLISAYDLAHRSGIRYARIGGLLRSGKLTPDATGPGGMALFDASRVPQIQAAVGILLDAANTLPRRELLANTAVDRSQACKHDTVLAGAVELLSGLFLAR